MTTLANIMKSAQRDANQDRRMMTVWNLNRYSPLYVIRLARDGDAERNGFIATIHPEEPNEDDLEAILA